MKFKKLEPTFSPLQITIESQEELNVLIYIVGRAIHSPGIAKLNIEMMDGWLDALKSYNQDYQGVAK